MTDNGSSAPGNRRAEAARGVLSAAVAAASAGDGEAAAALHPLVAPVLEAGARSGAEGRRLVEGAFDRLGAPGEARPAARRSGRSPGDGVPSDDGGSKPRALVVDCGVGDLLAGLDDRFDAVGIDRRPALARAARTRTGGPDGTDGANGTTGRRPGVAVGHPERLPVVGPVDAVLALDYLLADPAIDPGAVLGAVRSALAPGGVAVVDALVEPRASLDDDGTVGGYRVERTVGAARSGADRASAGVEYRLTDPDGKTVSTTADVTWRLTDRETLRARLTDAGLVDVQVGEKRSEPGAVVATARRPVED